MQSCYAQIEVPIDLFHPLVVIMSAGAALMPLNAAGHSSQEVSSAQCTPSVNELHYPAAALSGRIEGTVWVTVDFDNQGAITSIESKGYPLLVSEVLTALRSARPTTTCSGQKAAMRFSFVMDQHIDPNTPISAKPVTALDYEIVAPAEMTEVSNSDPPWIFTRKGRFFHHLKMALSKLKFW